MPSGSRANPEDDSLAVLREQPDRLTNELSRCEMELREARGQLARLGTHLQEENVYLKDEIKAEQSFTSLIGDSKPMARVRKAILQVAKTDSTVLILGETGTGKELIARAIHKIS